MGLYAQFDGPDSGCMCKGCEYKYVRHNELKMKGNTPRRKRFNRKQRLQSGQSFIKEYHGKNIVNGYSKWYGVNKLCAIKELRELGVIISDEYEKSIQNQKIISRPKDIIEIDQNPRFFIAGETSNGVPYGIIYDDNIDYLDEQLLIE